MIVVACPKCQKQLTVPENLAGTKVECPYGQCRERFIGGAPRVLPVTTLGGEWLKNASIAANILGMVVCVLGFFGGIASGREGGLIIAAAAGIGLYCLNSLASIFR